MLKAADWIPLITARGGLLKLLKIYFASPLESLGVADFWAAFASSRCRHAGLQDRVSHPRQAAHSGSLRFRTRAHSLGTSAGQRPRLSAPRLARQCLIVLPWIGEGIAGSRYLSAAGMIYFAAAHTAFFALLALLALLYARFTR
jgi:hypothetical protein